MDKTSGQIYKEIIEGLNKCMGNDNFFKGTKVLVDRRDKNNVLTTELTPYFYDETMNFKLYWVYNSKLKYTSLELKHKYKEHKLCIYKAKTVDSYPQASFDIDVLIWMFESKCKEYYLAAEAYFKNKNIADEFLNDMKTEEYKLI